MDSVITLLGLVIGVLVGVVGCNADQESSNGSSGNAADTPTGGATESSAGGATESSAGGATESSAGGATESSAGTMSDPAPSDLLAWVTSQDYRQWARAPGYEARRGSLGPHGGSVDIYVNSTVVQALAGSGLTEWPNGSVIVKDGFQGEAQRLTAIMLKRNGEWQWAEYYSSGDAFAGAVSVCTNCHRPGSDFVRAFALP